MCGGDLGCGVGEWGFCRRKGVEERKGRFCRCAGRGVGGKGGAALIITIIILPRVVDGNGGCRVRVVDQGIGSRGRRRRWGTISRKCGFGVWFRFGVHVSIVMMMRVCGKLRGWASRGSTGRRAICCACCDDASTWDREGTFVVWVG